MLPLCGTFTINGNLPLERHIKFFSAKEINISHVEKEKALHFQLEDLHSTRQSEDITDLVPPLAMQEELKHNHV